LSGGTPSRAAIRSVASRAKQPATGRPWISSERSLGLVIAPAPEIERSQVLERRGIARLELDQLLKRPLRVGRLGVLE
jgi:hypothetical protein